jgi:CheY-like chemotaxis protein
MVKVFGVQNRKLRILLVDDDEDEYVITDMLLGDEPAAPYILDWAKSYQEALLLLQDHPSDVILLDSVEGYKSGLDFIRKLKSQVDIPVISYTGFDYPWYVEEAMQAGATLFLSKRTASAESLWNSILFALVRQAIVPSS